FTEQGQLLLALADKILPEIRATLAKCQQNKPHHLRLAVECHSCIQWLLPVLTQFKQRYPHITLDYQSGLVFEPQPVLLQGELDIVLTADKINLADIIYLPLFEFEIRLAFAPTHPLANQSVIDAKDLATQTLLIYPVQQNRLDIVNYFLKPAHIQMKLKEVDNTALLMQMVAADMGIAALPHWVVYPLEKQQLITTRSLGKGLWRTLYAAISKQHLLEHEI